MDVRFYPATNSIPGDSANLDLSQCLGYYTYNKVNRFLYLHCVMLYVRVCKVVRGEG